MKYYLVLTSSAERELKKLPPQIQDEIFEKIESLQNNPRPQGYKKLTNFKVPNLKLKPERIERGFASFLLFISL